MQLLKECGKHEVLKRNEKDDLIWHICETCDRHYYVCEVCRVAKDLISLNPGICLSCAPSYNRLKPYMERRERESYDMAQKLKKAELELKLGDDMRRHLMAMKTHVEASGTRMLDLKRRNIELKKENERLKALSGPELEISRSLQDLLVKQELTDCIVKCGGLTLPAHKCILAARSETMKNKIFGRAAEHVQAPPAQKAPQPAPAAANDKKAPAKGKEPPKEQPKPAQAKPAAGGVAAGASTTIEITDVDPSLMPSILQYIYTGDTHFINDRNMHDVQEAAKRLQITSLQRALQAQLEKKINKSTVISILIEACETNNEALREKCLKYMQHEHMQDFVHEEEHAWMQFKDENPRAALEILERLRGGTGEKLAMMSSRSHTHLSHKMVKPPKHDSPRLPQIDSAGEKKHAAKNTPPTSKQQPQQHQQQPPQKPSTTVKNK